MTTITNPTWQDANHTTISYEINGGTYFVGLPTLAEPQKTITDEIISGKYGPIAEYVPPPPPVITAEQNKATAQSKLASTDWVNQPDVYDPAYNPHLMNRDEYLQYRSQVRAVAVNPTSGPIDWPTEPTPQWSQSSQ
jgi:hypothetical protein